mmetsp:Transcript_7800/g.27797  ORF Transcript_7800/g.27797 Transcript_7800/m.27797 type:complete len:83 (+) Transcript_7800:1436-1684(+)
MPHPLVNTVFHQHVSFVCVARPDLVGEVMFTDDDASLSDALAENNEEDPNPHDSLVCLDAWKEPRFHSEFEQSDAMGKHVRL